MGFFKSTKTTYDPMTAYSSEQQNAIRALQSLANTGSGAGITLGDAYAGDLGSYDLTSQSQRGLSALQDLLSGAYSSDSDIGKARSTYTSLADTRFDPSDPKSGYAAFSRSLAKAGEESASIIDREQAISGSRFGTGTMAQKADLTENLQLQRQQALANLFQNSQAMQLAGAQGLTGLADQIGQLSGMNITYGDMQRQLQDAKAKDAYDEYTRQQSEEYARIGLMTDQMNNPMGTMSIKSPSMFSNLISSALGAVGSFVGGQATGDYASQFGKTLTGGANNTTSAHGQMSARTGQQSSSSQGGALSSTGLLGNLINLYGGRAGRTITSAYGNIGTQYNAPSSNYVNSNLSVGKIY